MGINKALYSSKKMDWGTPQKFFDMLDRKYGPFDLDPCATHENAKCPSYMSKKQNGLKQKWTGKVFCNPPYGKDIGKWIEKAVHESKKESCTVVMLLPARTDTRYFHDLILPNAELVFVKGRLRFEGAPSSAPFPSILAIFGNKKHNLKRNISSVDNSGKL